MKYHTILNTRESNKNQISRRLKLAAVFMIMLLVSIAVAPDSLFAGNKSSGVIKISKRDLGGYKGPDARYIVKGLAEPEVKPGFKFKVGYLQPFAGVNVLLTIQKECEKKIKALGGEFIAYDAGLDIQKQVSQMDQLISQKVDLIIAYPVTEAGLTQGIATAKAAGIRVIMSNVPSNSEIPMDKNADATVGMAFDLYDYMTIKYIAKKYPGTKTAFLGFAPPAENLIHIMGRSKYWAKKMRLNILGGVDALDASPNAASVATQGIMGKYPDVKVIIGYNDYATMAAVTALKAAGKKGVLVATPNGGQHITAAAIKDGSAVCAYRDPWEKLGETLAIQAYNILTGQNLPIQRRVLLIGELATKGNVDSLEFVH